MKIVADSSDVRLDKYLSSSTDYSRALIEKMLASGFITIGGEVKKGSYKVKIGDEIELDETFKIDTDILPEEMPLDIIYEDDDLIILNKPSGLVVHPGSGNFAHTLVNGLMAYTKSLSDVNGVARCGIVHRLDKDTSGLMVVAKNNKAHALLADMFKDHTIKRTYMALLIGNLPYERATIDAPIKRDGNNFKQMSVLEGGKKAITHLKVLKRFKGYTLVSLNLETGRTHQIRVHMKYIGYPVYNDPVYSGKAATDFGQFLHSWQIEFIHPISGKFLKFECPCPQEMQEFIDNLK